MTSTQRKADGRVRSLWQYGHVGAAGGRTPKLIRTPLDEKPQARREIIRHARSSGRTSLGFTPLASYSKISSERAAATARFRKNWVNGVSHVEGVGSDVTAAGEAGIFSMQAIQWQKIWGGRSLPCLRAVV